MKTRKAGSRITKKLTKEDRLRHAAIRREIEVEKPDLVQFGLTAKAAFDARQTKLNAAVAALKATHSPPRNRH